MTYTPLNPEKRRNLLAPNPAWIWLRRIPGAMLRQQNRLSDEIEELHDMQSQLEQELVNVWDYSDEDALLIVNPDRSPVLPTSESVRQDPA